MRRILLIIAGAVVTLMVIAGVVPQRDDRDVITPMVPGADRYQQGKIFLERADRLSTRPGTDYQILTGDVVFRKNDMFMYCDSAHFYDITNSLEAFGNVRMEQGDTLFVYADELVYTDSLQLAVLYADNGKNVRLINRDVTLTTTIFNYDLGIDLGYYEVGGTLTDAKNRLTSLYGEYAPPTNEANFRTDVHLESIGESDTLNIYTEDLYYNTQSHVALMNVPSVIVNKDGKIFTDSAAYNTETSYADLYRRSIVVTRNNNTLVGDTLIYDRQIGYGEAFGNVIMTDSVKKVMLLGDYGFYNELTDSAFVTGRALAKEYSQGDTLHLHADTIRLFTVIIPSTEEIVDSITRIIPADTTHHMVAAHRVKFYRTDLQGICDSMTFIQRDSMLYMDRHPIVWSDNRQIFGNIIQVHLNDSTVDYALLPEFGFMAEEIEEGFYQQLTGKEMLAHFTDGHLTQLDVSGNVEAISLPMENDSTYNKMATLETSFMVAHFAGNALERIKTWPETTSTIVPLYLAKRAQLYLPQFKWYAPLRPTGPEDVFIISEEFLELMKEPDPAPKSRSDRKNISRSPNL
ncbi:MAG: hypothetical protein K2M07_06540 [Muribaculaceae bacterium]|nr:hypothetical protein [Muribaculaceae bacterium]